MARPSDFTPEIAAAICSRIASGESLRTICKDEATPAQSTVFKWLAERKEFSDQYARAREAQADAMAEDILDIADNGTNDWTERQVGDGEVIEVVNHDHIQRSRLRVDARKWLMARMAPKKYGDKVTQEISGPNGGPVVLWASKSE